MIVYSDFGEFYWQVGMLGHIDDFEGLRIKPCRLLGSFDEGRLPELISFCESNPSFHIISHTIGGTLLNKLDEEGLFFKLGRGDNNPNIVYGPNQRVGFQL